MASRKSEIQSPPQSPLEAVDREVMSHLRARTAQLERENADLHEELGSRRDFVSQVLNAVHALPPISQAPRPKILFEQSSSSVVAVLMLSDWQIGEVIKASETEGFGEFNFAIAEERVLGKEIGLRDKFLGSVSTQRRSFKIDELVILSLADLISGNIHKELEITNEFPVPVAVAKSGHLLAELVYDLSRHFDSVRVVEIDADNHGRKNPKPQAKQKGANNEMYLVHTIANQEWSRLGNLKIEHPEGMKHITDIAGWRFLCEHGDTIMGWMGIPYYGMERSRGREAVKRMAEPEHIFNYMAIGHWHVPAIISGNILVNGSLTGTTEFDHSQGRHAEPAQVSFLVHPKHGFFNWTKWRLRKR